MGFDTTLITDNMPAFVMAKEGVDVFTCAADAISVDGYVFNKVGTSQIAICAKHCGVPVVNTPGNMIGCECTAGPMKLWQGIIQFVDGEQKQNQKGNGFCQHCGNQGEQKITCGHGKGKHETRHHGYQKNRQNRYMHLFHSVG